MKPFKATVFCDACGVCQKAACPQTLGDAPVANVCPVCRVTFYVDLVSGQGFVARTRVPGMEPTRRLADA